MEIKQLTKKPFIDQSAKLTLAYNQFNELLSELRKRELPDNVQTAINQEIDKINAAAEREKEWRSQWRKSMSKILQLMEKKLKLVTINHYRNTWMAIGLSAFGIPFGVALGASLGSMAFLGIGLPIGLAIGMALGTSMDKKAAAEGRQLNLEIKY